ncbi:MAG: DUF6908 domain-containing protein [Candidatus Hinthialibacter sp.]
MNQKENVMKALNVKSTQIFESLYQLAKEDGHIRIDNNPSFMPVSVEIIQITDIGDVVSVAHYGEQNGDLMSDPEMTFLRTPKGNVVPMSYCNHYLGVYRESVRITERIEDGKQQVTYNPVRQAEHAQFANKWMRNIKEQQNLEV